MAKHRADEFDESGRPYLGERMKKARCYRGYSLRELAPLIGVSVAALNNYELGKQVASLAIMVRWAEFLKVSLDGLVNLGEGGVNFGRLHKSSNDG